MTLTAPIRNVHRILPVLLLATMVSVLSGCIYVRDLSGSGAGVEDLARLMTRHTVDTGDGTKEIVVVAVDGKPVDPEVTRMVTLRPGNHEIAVSYTKTITRPSPLSEYAGLRADEAVPSARPAPLEVDEAMVFSALRPKTITARLDRGRVYHVTADDLFLIVKREPSGSGGSGDAPLFALEGNWNPAVVER